MDNAVVLQEVAFAIVQGDGTIRRARGCTAVRTNPGIYLFTFDPTGIAATIPIDEVIGSVCPVNVLSTTGSIFNQASPVTKSVRTADQAGVLTDSEFSVTFYRLL